MEFIALWLYVSGVLGFVHFTEPSTNVEWFCVIFWPFIIPIMKLVDYQARKREGK
jgi:hypothetical protein